MSRPGDLIRPGDTTVSQMCDETIGRAVAPYIPSGSGLRRPGVVVAARTALMRVTLTACLEEAGFRVWAAESGVELLVTFLRHRDRVDVLFVEAELPDLPAPALYDRLQIHLPAVPCCFFSPSRESPAVEDARVRGATVVTWPVPEDRLADMLWAEVLAVTALEA